MRPFDSAFQEALSLSHLKYGLAATRGIAGFGEYDGAFLFHAAHPPLLQLVYAALYSVCGVHEWVSRSFAMACAVGTALLIWATLCNLGFRKAAIASALFFALCPLSVMIGRTTNYEPPALFFIALIFYSNTLEGDKRRAALMTAAAFVGGFFEWTVYLALPAVFICDFGEHGFKKSVKRILLPSIAAAVALASTLAWQYSVVGNIPMLGHAGVRSDPKFLLEFSEWFHRIAALLRGIGWGIIPAAAGLFFAARDWKKSQRFVSYLIAWAAVPTFFAIAAPDLVLVHPLASLYAVPFFAVAAGYVAESIPHKIAIPALGIIFAIFGFQDVKLASEKSPLFYDIANYVADRLPAGKKCRAFDSTATGYLIYYKGIETFHAVGANEPPIEKFADDGTVCAFILDVSNPEVGYVKNNLKTAIASGKIFLQAKAQGMEIWMRGDDRGILRLANMLDFAELPPASENFWENPETNFTSIRGARYVISHQPRANSPSVIKLKHIYAPVGSVFKTEALLDPAVCNNMQTDGVEFSVTIFGGEFAERVEGTIVPEGGECKSQPIEIKINEGTQKVTVELSVLPKGNANFDKFYWDDPRIVPQRGE